MVEAANNTRAIGLYTWKMNHQTKNIALFPLDIFLLPGDYTQLYIFEPRYKQLIRECDQDQMSTFGIACLNSFNTANFGSLVELQEVVRHYPGGEMDILVKATAVFELHDFNIQKEGKLYPEGEISIVPEITNETASLELQADFRIHLLKYNSLNTHLLSDEQVGIFDIANELGMNEQEKLELAGLHSNSYRDRYLINYLRYLEFLEKQESSVQNDIYLN